MNICKSLLKRLGLVVGAFVLLPIASVVLTAILAICVPVFIAACIVIAITASNDVIDDLFMVQEVDPNIVVD